MESHHLSHALERHPIPHIINDTRRCIQLGDAIEKYVCTTTLLAGFHERAPSENE